MLGLERNQGWRAVRRGHADDTAGWFVSIGRLWRERGGRRWQFCSVAADVLEICSPILGALQTRFRRTRLLQPIIAETKRERFQIPPGTEKSLRGPRFLPGEICRSREEFGWHPNIAPGKSLPFGLCNYRLLVKQ